MSDDTNKPKPAEKPSWWNEEQHGEWTNDHAMALSGFQEVLGRGIAPTSAEVAGINNWADYYHDHGYDGLTAQLSLSDEARLRGVDPTAYGNTIVDPETLSEKDREWYNAWAESHPGETFYSGILEQLSWRQGLYSVDVYRGMNDGTITVDGSGVITVTPEAVETYGGENLVFHHGRAGQLIRVPEDSGVVIEHRRVFKGKRPEGFTDEQWDKWMSEQNSDGYTLYSTSPPQKKGIGHYVSRGLKDIGLGSDAVDFVMAAVPVVATIVGGPLAGALTAPLAAPFVDDALGINEAYFVTDPLGVTSGTHWGTEGMQRNLAGGMNFFNTTDAERFQLAQGIGRGIVGTVATIATGGLAGVAIGATWSAIQNVNRAAAGTQSWGDAFTNIGIGTASSALMVDGGGVGAAFVNAANSSVAGMLQTGLTTGDWDAALEQGAVSGLSSLASAGFNAALRPTSAGMGALYGAGSGMATAYGAGALLGMEGDELQNSVINAGIQGAIRGAASGSKRDAYYNKKDPNTGKTGYETASAHAMQWGPPERGDMPLAQDAGAWAGVRNWATDWGLGNTPWGQSRIAQEFLGAVTPWATTYEIESMYGGNQRAAAPAAPAAAATGKPGRVCPAQWPLVGELFSTGGRHLSQGWNWATDAERAWIPG